MTWTFGSRRPGELPVGFWNQSGLTFNLLRDDLGVEGDATDRNYEMSYSRGIPSGEYVVNVHMYGHVPRGVRVPVRVVVSIKRPLEDPEQIAATTVELRGKESGGNGLSLPPDRERPSGRGQYLEAAQAADHRIELTGQGEEVSMDVIYFIFAAMTLTAFLLGALAVWAPRKTWVRFAAVGAVSLLLPLGYVQFMELMSRPKPMAFAWFEQERDKAIVLGIDFDEGERIYLWLRLSGVTEPRYYSIPWNPRFAEELQDGLEDAVRRNSVLVITNPFSPARARRYGGLERGNQTPAAAAPEGAADAAAHHRPPRVQDLAWFSDSSRASPPIL